MDLIHTVDELRKRLAREPSIVLVPTMGNLHAGHVTLVEIARSHGKCVVVTIFVNRLQFGAGGDFDRYPRTLEADCDKLAGAGIVLMEAMPAAVAKQVTESLTVPTIGIGAGPDVSGQVLVVYDMLDIFPGRKARFVKNFMEGAPSVKAAIEAYVKAVKGKTFPGPEHCF